MDHALLEDLALVEPEVGARDARVQLGPDTVVGPVLGRGIGVALEIEALDGGC
jgi:hypothetical protein